MNFDLVRVYVAINILPGAAYKSGNGLVGFRHTTYLVPCGTCNGSQYVDCGACKVTGKVLCSACNGNGSTSCGKCLGSGSSQSKQNCVSHDSWTSHYYCSIHGNSVSEYH